VRYLSLRPGRACVEKAKHTEKRGIGHGIRLEGGRGRTSCCDGRCSAAEHGFRPARCQDCQQSVEVRAEAAADAAVLDMRIEASPPTRRTVRYASLGKRLRQLGSEDALYRHSTSSAPRGRVSDKWGASSGGFDYVVVVYPLPGGALRSAIRGRYASSVGCIQRRPASTEPAAGRFKSCLVFSPQPVGAAALRNPQGDAGPGGKIPSSPSLGRLGRPYCGYVERCLAETCEPHRARANGGRCL
jgi:hypothetical protein